ncbi:MAG: hypothetical protein RBS02_10595 [Steroidobacteraceae bacterium]|jgi:hypothetical protein|nr:hypothetical protein [Steroidobacteraceae bacterium]
MKVERLTASMQSRASSRREADPRAPAPGRLLQLTCARIAGNEVLARTADGLTLRLAGMIGGARDLRPGDTLLARVVANQPVLELELQPPAPRAPATNEARALSNHMAMRLDQAALQQLTKRLPGATALAASWRALAGESAGQTSGALGAAPSGSLVHHWGGVQVTLRAIESDHDDAPERMPRRYRRLALLVQLSSAALGRIELRAHWVAGGVGLCVYVDNAHAEQVVRSAIPGVAAAIAQASLRLAHFRVVRGDAPAPLEGSVVSAAAAPPALFRAAAEAAVVLLGMS